jgi:hypothetical protein
LEAAVADTCPRCLRPVTNKDRGGGDECSADAAPEWEAGAKIECQRFEIARLRAELARVNGADDPIVSRAGNEPVHLFFGLSYSTYLVWQRSILQAMPLEWQRRFVVLLNELSNAAAGLEDLPSNYQVNARENGRFVHDPYAQYRHVRVQLNLPEASPDAEA